LELVVPEIRDPLELVVHDVRDPLELVVPDIRDALELVVPGIRDALELVVPDIRDALELVVPDIRDALELVLPEFRDPLELVVPEIRDALELVVPVIRDALELVVVLDGSCDAACGASAFDGVSAASCHVHDVSACESIVHDVSACESISVPAICEDGAQVSRPAKSVAAFTASLPSAPAPKPRLKMQADMSRHYFGMTGSEWSASTRLKKRQLVEQVMGCCLADYCKGVPEHVLDVAIIMAWGNTRDELLMDLHPAALEYG
jgi:hypothetical protein